MGKPDQVPNGSRAHAWRRLVVLLAAALTLLAIGTVFWQQDLRYSLPTPRPAALVQVAIGTTVELPANVTSQGAVQQRKPLLLHFYNPDCPCSRFNRDHLRALQNRFGTAVQFVAVIESGCPEPGESGLPMPHIVDTGGALANQLGVYSTPQAVLLDGGQRLVFRGNYNVTRYCDDRSTQFARLAIEALLAQTTIGLDPDAATAYGCPLPNQECRDDAR